VSLSVSVFLDRWRASTSDFTDEEGFEGAGGVVPSETLSVSVPQLQTVFLLSILILEVVGLPSVPVLVGDGLPCGHPEELALLGLVSAGGPEVFVSHPEALYVILQVVLLLRRVDAGEVHPVEPAVLLRLVPVGLEKYS